MFKLFPFRRAAASLGHATVCDPQDAAGLAKLGRALKDVGADLSDHYESDLGVNRWVYRVGKSELVVFSDCWSVDLEGPSDVVDRVVARLRDE